MTSREANSVVLNRGQLRVQLHRDVLVEGAEGYGRAVAQVVKAVQVLPLLGIPQQFVPACIHISTHAYRELRYFVHPYHTRVEPTCRGTAPPPGGGGGWTCTCRSPPLAG